MPWAASPVHTPWKSGTPQGVRGTVYSRSSVVMSTGASKATSTPAKPSSTTATRTLSGALMNAWRAAVRPPSGTAGSLRNATPSARSSAAAASISGTAKAMWSMERPAVGAGGASASIAKSQMSPMRTPSSWSPSRALSPPNRSWYHARVAAGSVALRWMWWNPRVSASSTSSMRVPHGSKM